MATAAIDSVVDHPVIVEFGLESYRSEEALARMLAPSPPGPRLDAALGGGPSPTPLREGQSDVLTSTKTGPRTIPSYPPTRPGRREESLLIGK